MKTITQIEQLGSVQACPALLDESLAAQQGWQRHEEGVVVLDSGILLASPAAWQHQLQSICNLNALVSVRYPAVEWASADIAIVRKFVADADAVRRDRMAQAQAVGDPQTMARQLC